MMSSSSAASRFPDRLASGELESERGTSDIDETDLALSAQVWPSWASSGSESLGSFVETSVMAVQDSHAMSWICVTWNAIMILNWEGERGGDR